MQHVRQHPGQKQLRQRLLTFELHDAEHLHGRGHLLDIRQLHAIKLHERRYLHGLGQEQPERMHVRRHLLDFRQFIQIRVQLGGGLLIVAMDDAKQV